MSNKFRYCSVCDDFHTEDEFDNSTTRQDGKAAVCKLYKKMTRPYSFSRLKKRLVNDNDSGYNLTPLYNSTERRRVVDYEANSILRHKTNSYVMAVIREQIYRENNNKELTDKIVPFMSWKDFQQTRIVNKPY